MSLQIDATSATAVAATATLPFQSGDVRREGRDLSTMTISSQR
jgi:hypothetical protein